MLAIVAFILIKSGRLHTKRKNKEMQQQTVLSSQDHLINSCNSEVHVVMDKTISVLKRVIDGLKDENRKSVKKALAEATELYTKFKDKRDYEVVPTLENIQMNALDLEQEYVQLVDYSYEITKSLKAITESTFTYIDNNHAAFSKEQIDDLKTIFNTLTEVYLGYLKMEKENDYSNFDQVLNLRLRILELYAKMTKRQIKRVKEGVSNTRSSILFLNLVNESKIVTLQSGNLMKTHRNFKIQALKSGGKFVDSQTLIKNLY
jgi:Na+/phosphate symporter